MNQTVHNVDPNEVRKFEEQAHRWWDPSNPATAPLHEINPLRLGYIERRAGLEGRRVADVGCGGGILAEGMATRGARVLGIDMAEAAIEVAKMHLLESGLEVDYRHGSAEALAAEMPGAFDVVTCMELLEHVPDPASVVRACAELVKPGGDVFFATINRNPKSFLFAILGAEYLLRMLPRGTHEYGKFIRPSELDAWARAAGLDVQDITGLSYNPLTRTYRLGPDVDVNYMVHARKA